MADDSFFRVISNQVRFGCGRRTGEEISANRETADVFRRSFIDGHQILPASRNQLP